MPLSPSRSFYDLIIGIGERVNGLGDIVSVANLRWVTRIAM